VSYLRYERAILPLLIDNKKEQAHNSAYVLKHINARSGFFDGYELSGGFMQFNVGRIIIFLLIFFAMALFILLKFNKGSFVPILLFVLFAVPIPLSLLTIPFSLINFVGIFIGESETKGWTVDVIFFIIVMILAGTYSITYVLSLIITLKTKILSSLSFLPVAHIIITFLLYALTEWLQKNSGKII